MTTRVVWVLKELAVGGAERLLLDLAPHLDSDVEFLPVGVSDQPRTLVPALRDAGFDPVVLGSTGERDLRWTRALRRLVRERAADIVHLHGPYVGAIGRVALAGARVPVVSTEHSLWSAYHPLSRWANAVTYAANDAVVAVSSAVRDAVLRSWWGRRTGARLRVVPNGVDAGTIAALAAAERVAEPSPVDQGPAFGTVGHLRRRKGVDVLVRAAPLIAARVPGAHGYVAGVGEDAVELDHLRREIAPDTVTFLGLRRDGRAILSDLDVVVFASRVEGLPVAALEAMALARPIVTTTAGGLADVFTDGIDALVVPSDDPAALADAVARLLADRDLATRLGAEARRTVASHFDVRDTAAAYRAVYAELTTNERR